MNELENLKAFNERLVGIVNTIKRVVDNEIRLLNVDIQQSQELAKRAKNEKEVKAVDNKEVASEVVEDSK